MKERDYKKYLGMVVNHYTIMDIWSYWDFSTNDVEYCFTVDYGSGCMGVNCNLFIKKYITEVC